MRAPEQPAPLRLFFDLKDCAEFDYQALQLCDFYIKRSFASAEVAKLDEELGHKVLSMGVHYPCRTSSDSLPQSLQRAWATASAEQNPLSTCRRVLGTLAQRVYSGWPLSPQPPTLSELISAPEEPAQLTVYYRTRLYDPDRAPDRETEQHLLKLNASRIALIQSLRTRLQNRFFGGLAPTALTLRLCPELAYPLPEGASGQRGHLSMLRQHAISICSRGIHQSTGWKFGESLAASRCVVAERLAFSNRNGPLEGRDYLAFDDAEECAALCESLLANPHRVDQLRRAAQSVFLRNLTPAQSMRSTLQACVRSATDPGMNHNSEPGSGEHLPHA